MLDEQHVGRRVVVRYEISRTRPRYTDVLGELVEVTGTALVVRRADGTEVRIARELVRAAKPIPPRRAR